MDGKNIKISAFTLTTNATKFGYPFIESIKSFLPVVDELIVVDGGSTDKTIEMIEAIGDKKIRIVNDEGTKWEEDWTYSRMGKNKQIGYEECIGDAVIKFDADWVLHNTSVQYNILADNIIKMVEMEKLIVVMQRRCVNLIGESFVKRAKTIVVNKALCNKLNVDVDYKLDSKINNWAFEPTGVVDGKRLMLLDLNKRKCGTDAVIYNYGFFFSTKEQIAWARKRHIDAEYREKGKSMNISEDKALETYLKSLFFSRERLKKEGGLVQMKNYYHPKLLYDKINNLTINQQGYNFFEEL